MRPNQSFTLVLSGGGLKGLAHIGVLQALQDQGLVPSLVVGSSIGSLIAAAWAAGMPISVMRERALALRRRHIFQVAHADMALRRLLAPAIYRHEPLETVITGLVGARTFRDLDHPLLINTVDLNSGVQVMWGLPGLQNARVADAVFASCALPGIFPPREINGRFYVDGAVIENLPVRFAAASDQSVVAVNVAATSVLRADIQKQGFAATYIRGLEMVMQTQIEGYLRDWQGPPLLLIQPRVEHVSMFSFEHTLELMDEGYRATVEALDQFGHELAGVGRGMHPRRQVRIEIERGRCIGCGVCVIRAPEVFHLDNTGKARVTSPLQTWSPVDGASARDCPTGAIHIRPAELPPAA